MATRQRLLTAEEYENLPENKNEYRRDLIRGVLGVSEPPPQSRHSFVQGKITYLLCSFVAPRKLGAVGPHGGFWLETNPDTICAPDVWFLRAERVPPEDAMSYPRGAPDLAVEILSPSNTKREMAEKVALYLGSGARLVWCVDPKRRTIAVYRRDHDPDVLAADGILRGEDVLPGFECQVADIFDPYWLYGG